MIYIPYFLFGTVAIWTVLMREYYDIIFNIQFLMLRILMINICQISWQMLIIKRPLQILICQLFPKVTQPPYTKVEVITTTCNKSFLEKLRLLNRLSRKDLFRNTILRKDNGYEWLCWISFHQFFLLVLKIISLQFIGKKRTLIGVNLFWTFSNFLLRLVLNWF